MGETRRRSSAGVTTAQALEAQWRKRHELEGRKLGVPGFETAEAAKKQPLHVAITKYLEQIGALRRFSMGVAPVLNRFGEFFRDTTSIDAISGDDLTRFVVALKGDLKLGANPVLHNAVIVAQFLKHHGRSGITRELQPPERFTSLPNEYRDEELGQFFEACYDSERVLFSTFLLTGFGEQEVMYLFWSDINLQLRTVRVTAKPYLGFYPKRCEEREIPAPAELIAVLQKHTHRPTCRFVYEANSKLQSKNFFDLADNLLAGKLILPFEGRLLPLCCPALLCAGGNHSGEAERDSGIGLKTVQLHRGTTVHFHPGILFEIIPEHRSESSRNRVQLVPDSPYWIAPFEPSFSLSRRRAMGRSTV